MKGYVLCVVCFLGLGGSAWAAEAICPRFYCFASCPYGFLTNRKGCPSCSCLPSNVNCPERFCFSSCPNGFMKDKYGCASCSCLPDQEASSRTCQDHQCFMACDNGYKLDRETGCLTCTCAPDSAVNPKPSSSSDDKNPGFVAPGQLDPQCNEIRCLMACDKGDYLMDDKGCPTCVCESSPPSAKGFVKDTDDEDPSSGAGRTFPFWLPCLITMLRLLFP